MAREEREFVGGPWDGEKKEVDVVSVLAVKVEDPDGSSRMVKYYLGVDGRYHYDHGITDEG